jgi:glycosyltransferase involved in cell wall biosynthesis
VTIITGYSLGTVKLWVRKHLFGEPYIIWSGAITDAAMPTPRLRMVQRRMLVRAAAAFVAYGSRAKRYLETLGAPPDRVSIGINSVDTKFYRQRAVAGRAERNRAKEFDLICLGDLSARKRVDLALRAVKLVSEVRRDFRLRLIGDGPERAALEDLANDLGISDIVRFEGFKQKGEVAGILAAAHCLLFPSRFDVWGLVLVEAMAAGIPCIASVRAGATDDLIQDEVTGFAVDFDEPRIAADRVEWMLENRDAAREMGEAAADFIESNVSLERSAEGFLDAVKRALLVPPNRA